MPASKHLLTNGVRLIAIPQAESLSATLMILVEAGSKYETKEISGLSHFLEHLCFKGTKKRRAPLAISSALDSLGAQYNAFTAQEYTGYYATVQPVMALPALEIISDIYLNSRFPEEEIAKERGVIVEEINMYEDMPQRHVQDLFLELVYGDQPAGWNIAGTREVVRSLAREQFLDYRRKRYVARGTIIVAAGRFALPPLARAVNSHFATLATTEKFDKPAVVEAQTAPKILIKHKASDQTHLVLGFRAYPVGHPDYDIAELLSAVLGGGMSSRLFRKIREELGAAYYVRSQHEAFTDHGLLAAAVGADNRRAATVVEAIIGECRKLRDQLVPAAELERVKSYLVGNLYLGLETTNSLALFYGLQEIWRQPLKSPQALAQRLKRVSAADIRRVARQIFTPERLNLSLIGPFTDEAQFAPLLKNW